MIAPAAPAIALNTIPGRPISYLLQQSLTKCQDRGMLGLDVLLRNIATAGQLRTRRGTCAGVGIQLCANRGQRLRVRPDEGRGGHQDSSGSSKYGVG